MHRISDDFVAAIEHYVEAKMKDSTPNPGMTREQLDDLRKAALAATPGPWEWDGNVCDYDPENEAPWLVRKGAPGEVLKGEIKCEEEANRDYLATFNPATVLALLDHIEAGQSREDALRAELSSARADGEPIAQVVARTESTYISAEEATHSGLGYSGGYISNTVLRLEPLPGKPFPPAGTLLCAIRSAASRLQGEK